MRRVYVFYSRHIGVSRDNWSGLSYTVSRSSWHMYMPRSPASITIVHRCTIICKLTCSSNHHTAHCAHPSLIESVSAGTTLLAYSIPTHPSTTQAARTAYISAP